MLEKIGLGLSLIGAIPTIYIIWSKVSEAAKMIDKTLFLEIVIVIMTFAGGAIYLIERLKKYLEKRNNYRQQITKEIMKDELKEDRGKINKLQKFVDDYVYNSDQLLREVKKVDVERQQILNEIKNYRNALETKIENLENKLPKVIQQKTLADYDPYEKK